MKLKITINKVAIYNKETQKIEILEIVSDKKLTYKVAGSLLDLKENSKIVEITVETEELVLSAEDIKEIREKNQTEKGGK